MQKRALCPPLLSEEYHGNDYKTRDHQPPTKNLSDTRIPTIGSFYPVNHVRDEQCTNHNRSKILDAKIPPLADREIRLAVCVLANFIMLIEPANRNTHQDSHNQKPEIVHEIINNIKPEQSAPGSVDQTNDPGNDGESDVNMEAFQLEFLDQTSGAGLNQGERRINTQGQNSTPKITEPKGNIRMMVG
jgi:hypothetical protein